MDHTILHSLHHSQNQDRRDIDLALAYAQLHQTQLTQRAPSLRRQTYNEIPLRPAQKQQTDKKSNASQRQSYMYNIPALDAKKIQQLKKYLIEQKQQNNNNQVAINNHSKCCTSLSDININSWYYIAMVIAEVILLAVYFIVIYTTDTTRRICLAVLLILASVIYGLWAFYLGCIKQDIDRFWACIWISFCATVLCGAIGGAANLWEIALAGACVIFAIQTWLLITIRRKASTGVLILIIAIPQIVISFLVTFIITSSFAGPNMTVASPFLAISGIYLILMIVDICNNRWSIRSQYQKWQLLCNIHLFVIMLIFSLTIGIPGNLVWVYITQVINFLFLCNTVYFLFYVLNISCCSGWHGLNLIQKIKSIINKQIREKYNPNILFPISDVLLTRDPYSMNNKNPRLSVYNKPLAACICCYSEQSRFVYQKCLHACVGHLCILDWLKRGVQKCPLCRQISDIMIQVKRLDASKFQIQKKYRIKQ